MFVLFCFLDKVDELKGLLQNIECIFRQLVGLILDKKKKELIKQLISSSIQVDVAL